ncbi:MAG: hypothetical protein ACLQFR_04160 [Streptosporangiaceae bacterium]
MAADSEGPPASRPNWWQRALGSGAGQAVRWLVVLALVVGHWLVTVLGPVTGHGHWLTTASLVFGQKGNPGSFTGWVPVIVISVLLLLPDADSVAFGGVKLEMRRTREEVTGLRSQVTNLQVAQARAAAIGAMSLRTENPEVARVFAASVGLLAKTAASEDTEIEDYDPGA